MKFDYKKYPITSVVIGICMIVYIYKTLIYDIEVSIYQDIDGKNTCLNSSHSRASRMLSSS